MYTGYISLVCMNILENSVVDTQTLTCTQNTCILFLQLNPIWRSEESHLLCVKNQEPSYSDKDLVLTITIKD